MKSARHQLVLLGLICQALSWDAWIAPLLSALLWALCLTVPRKPLKLGPLAEFALIWIGVGLGHWLDVTFNKHLNLFVSGYGLMLVQLARLMRPLDRREKISSVLIACFHLAVACTIILDFRFVFILCSALYLIPRALAEVEAESLADPKKPTVAAPRISFSLKNAAAVLLVMVLFYLLFPRGFGAQFPAPRFGGDAGLLEAALDPARSGMANSDRVLLQVEGEHLSYLRCYALVDFDGQKWTPENWDFLVPLGALSPNERTENLERRRVRVKNADYLGKVLPVDGRAVRIDGKFFRNAARTQHSTVKAQVMWNSANNFYEYWIEKNPGYEPLRSTWRERYTAYPEQSARLQQWLDQLLAGIDDPLQQAQKLEDFFYRNFAYKIGAPELSKINTADDFIFNQREGHCERFAAHLALLLRMKGIPSRVIVGYVPNSKSWFTGRYNVRFRDAHAWTEAWFKGKGWVQFDATPAATIDRSGNQIRELFDTLDFVWYSRVVSLDGAAQSQLFNSSAQFFGKAAQWLRQNLFWLAVPFVLLLVMLAKKVARRFRFSGKTSRKKIVIAAEHCYGQMLRELAKKGVERQPQQTPFEFLQELEKNPAPWLDDARLITKTFCKTRYGFDSAAEEEILGMETALKRMKLAAR